MSMLEHVALRHAPHGLRLAALESFRVWRATGRRRRLERLTARQLADISPHMLSDIGLVAPERDRGTCLRLWTGGAA